MKIKSILIGFTIIFALFIMLSCFPSPPQSGTDTLKVCNIAVNPVTGQTIAESKEWIYRQDAKTGGWTKLIPGRCPQWFPNGKRFYYFMDVGYDGCRAQLWSADENGEARLRMSTSDYFIRRSPIVSSNGKKLAWHYSCCHASGFWEDIKVVCLNSLDDSAEEKVVLRYPEGTKIGPIKWATDDVLLVIVNGKVKEVETTGKEIQPLP